MDVTPGHSSVRGVPSPLSASHARCSVHALSLALSVAIEDIIVALRQRPNPPTILLWNTHKWSTPSQVAKAQRADPNWQIDGRLAPRGIKTYPFHHSCNSLM